MEKSTRLGERENEGSSSQTTGRAGAAGALIAFIVAPVIDARALVVGHSSLLASQVPRPSLPSTRVISAGAGQSRRWWRQAGICPTHCVPSLFPQLHRHHNTFRSVPFPDLLSWQEGSPSTRLAGRGETSMWAVDGWCLEVPVALLLQSAVCTSVSNLTLDTGQQGRGAENTTIRRELYGLRDR